MKRKVKSFIIFFLCKIWIWYEKKFGKTRDRITDVLRIEIRKIKENEERVSS